VARLLLHGTRRAIPKTPNEPRPHEPSDHSSSDREHNLDRIANAAGERIDVQPLRERPDDRDGENGSEETAELDHGLRVRRLSGGYKRPAVEVCGTGPAGISLNAPAVRLVPGLVRLARSVVVAVEPAAYARERPGRDLVVEFAPPRVTGHARRVDELEPRSHERLHGLPRHIAEQCVDHQQRRHETGDEAAGWSRGRSGDGARHQESRREHRSSHGPASKATRERRLLTTREVPESRHGASPWPAGEPPATEPHRTSPLSRVGDRGVTAA
jgi:hypothetical protein